MYNRYLISFHNPDCGVGHAISILNSQLKISINLGLTLGYSAETFKKSSASNLSFKIKSFIRFLVKGKFSHTHDLGNDVDVLFNPADMLEDLNFLREQIQAGNLKVIQLPHTIMPIKWHEQSFETVYGEIAEVVSANPQSNVVFQMPDHWKSESEFEGTIDWFQVAYQKARKIHPIKLPFPDKERFISVHIRRGDLLPGGLFDHLGSRMLPDEWYETLVRIVATIPEVENWNLLILTDGFKGQAVDVSGSLSLWDKKLENLPFKEVVVNTGGPFLEDFHAMVSSDLFIGSRSGMSHLAAHVNSGVKLVPSFWSSYRAASSVLEFPDDVERVRNRAVDTIQFIKNELHDKGL